MSETPRPEGSLRIDAAAEWRDPLTRLNGALLLFLSVTGLLVELASFSPFVQLSVLTHTAFGLLALLPLLIYTLRHWWVRRRGNFSHYQLLGYAAWLLLAACCVSGVVVTWQGLMAPRLGYAWDLTHLLSGFGVILLVAVHLATVFVKKETPGEVLAPLRSARGGFVRWSVAGGLAPVLACALALGAAREDDPYQAFPDDYEWRFGEERPFAPSLARVDPSVWREPTEARLLERLDPAARSAFRAAVDEALDPLAGYLEPLRQGLVAAGRTEDASVQDVLERARGALRARGAVSARALARSESCGTSNCHEQIYAEWQPGAHRYSSMDDMFQRVQTLMSQETSPEHTRYCAGCHDAISLFSGAKNSGNITLSAEGANEGTSCVVCHSIVQSDVQGNGDYTLLPARRYLWELDDGALAKRVSDFLIRTYPDQHVASFSRALYKTTEFCAACHKQYVDKEVNTDIGKVQGQNQYDSWRNSRWFHGDDDARTLACRDCHMPLVESRDPAWGDPSDRNRHVDDRRHRSHRFLASNQYIPLVHQLPGAQEHVELTERWLRGDIDIPEIADRWTEGPVVRLAVEAPAQARAGQPVSVRVVLTNNKTGHDFPTGPLDMIESWLEVTARDQEGSVVFASGATDARGDVQDTAVSYRADGFDRQGQLIDRHNLWDLVGASYKRALYPGVTDAVSLEFQCPSMARGRVRPGDDKEPPGRRAETLELAAPASGELRVEAQLWYRKANPAFLDRVYGSAAKVRAPATLMSRGEAVVRVVD